MNADTANGHPYTVVTVGGERSAVWSRHDRIEDAQREQELLLRWRIPAKIVDTTCRLPIDQAGAT